MNSGRYVWDSERNKVVKISDKAKVHLTVGRVDGTGYYDQQLGEYITCEKQKRRILKENNLHVKEPGEIKHNRQQKKERKKINFEKAVKAAVEKTNF